MIPSELFIGTGLGDDYDIPYSLRFRSSASAYLSRSVGSNANGGKFTISIWVKRGNIGSPQYYISDGATSFTTALGFDSSDRISMMIGNQTNTSYNILSSAVFRDPSAWYNIVVSVNTSSSIASERVRLYCNGLQLSVTGTQPTQSFGGGLSASYPWRIGDNTSAIHYYFDGYLTEVNVIDGQALTPDNFGTFSSTTGQWSPKKYSGTYGNNGFYLDFKDAGAVANLGYDKSGNNNHWTPTNISLTASVNYDSMLDTPTNNFTVGNPLVYYLATLNSGNLQTTSFSIDGWVASSFAASSGKWYCEITPTALTVAPPFEIGIIKTRYLSSTLGYTGTLLNYSISYMYSLGSRVFGTYNPGSTWPSYTVNDVIGIAFDIDSGSVSFYKNGVLAGTVNNTLSGEQWSVFVANQRGGGCTCSYAFNFGQRPFAYTPPAGFEKLCSKNLPEPSIKRGETGMDIATYTGNGGNIQVGEYQFPRPNYLIDRSLRSRTRGTTYLSRAVSGSNTATKATMSLWVKPSETSIASVIFSTNRSFATTVEIQADNTLRVYTGDGISSGSWAWISSKKFIDNVNWTNIIVSWDTTQAVATDRLKVYANGVLITSWSTQQTIVQNMVLGFSGSTNMLMPSCAGHLAEVNFIDGQALTPSSFGEQDINGYWIPKAYTGTYGTNGFYLPFSDNSALTTSSNVGIGKDFSGNGNYWTTNNISLTAGATYDSMTDTPTNNYSVLNALSKTASSTLSNGNLSLTSTAGGTAVNFQPAISTFKMSGKMYFEWTYSTGDAYWIADVGLGTIGFNPSANGQNTYVGNQGNGISFYRSYGYAGTIIMQNSVQTNIATSYVHTDTLAMAYDSSTGKVWAAVNGVWVNNGNPETGANPIGYINEDCWIAVNPRNLVTINLNCGQRPFTYTPPTGFKSLSIHNIAEYSYDLETPDLVWIKSRNAATNHMLFDSIRGAGHYISSNLTSADTIDVNSLISFNKNGFYLGNNANVNTLNNTYVSWMWKAGSSEVTNTAGTISSQVRADPAKGFSVVKYVGANASGTVGHGLGLTPKLILTKPTSGAYNWTVYHSSLAANQYLVLNLTQQVATNASLWNNTAPTTSVFSVGDDGGHGAAPGSSETHIAYCFSEIAGYSKFGSYIGNGSADGPFVYCGFKPRWILVKRTDSTGNWHIRDTSRDSYNTETTGIFGNLANAESVQAAFDGLSNGFKCRDAGGVETNANGATYIYAAFAETPFKYATAR